MPCYEPVILTDEPAQLFLGLKLSGRTPTSLIDMDRNIRSAALDDLLPSDRLYGNIH